MELVVALKQVMFLYNLFVQWLKKRFFGCEIKIIPLNIATKS
jgi:hypothetical protein